MRYVIADILYKTIDGSPISAASKVTVPEVAIAKSQQFIKSYVFVSHNFTVKPYSFIFSSKYFLSIPVATGKKNFTSGRSFFINCAA